MNFERGIDPKHTLKIGKRTQIDLWFEKWAPNTEYTVDENLHIKIERNLYLKNTLITSLPENLSVGGWLDLSNSQISYLPDNLRIGGTLDLINTPITYLPDNLSVGSYLDIRNTKITSLPENLKVEGSIYKNFS